ncbi:MAG: flagellar biosynthetic protein FliO [Chromatiaceae bacterium]|nr:flagellar biosynthetic protein FliO [Chromatiaceae bacterium]HPE80546.1 flagellar biosynthetic protein FliO [Gammaproteobacteria bacterium]
MNKTSFIAAPLILLAEAIGAAPGEASSRLVESPLSTANLVETALGLVVVLGVMLGLAWLAKRYVQVPGVGKGKVQILGGVSLGAREKAVLLSVEGKRLLVGVAPGRVQTLLVLGGSQTAEDAFAGHLQAATDSVQPAVPGDPA